MLQNDKISHGTSQRNRCFRLFPTLACVGSGMVVGQAQKAPQQNQAVAASGAGRIIAVLQGMRTRDGYLRVSLYNTPDHFPNGVPISRKAILLPALNSATPLHMLTVTFDGLPSGTYAVCAFHDRDGNGKLKENLLGIPQEEWGMSNNPRPRFRSPRFDQAQLGLGPQEAKTISITLRK